MDQIRSAHAPSGTSRQLRPLRALTEQLKRTSGAALSCPPAPPSGSTEEADRVTQVLEELQNLRIRIDSNLELLEPFVTFLRMSCQVRVPDLEKVFSSLKKCQRSCSGFHQQNVQVTLSILKPLKLLNLYENH